MKEPGFRYIYGPVPSRRLGRSLGLDLVPFKTCTYDCAYCQLGRTTIKTIERKEYVPVKDVLAELEKKLAGDIAPDYISLAGSGEPTLNAGIGDLIGKIQGLTDIPVAVLTNGSLLGMTEVQDALRAADLVLPSLDAGDEHLFRYVNRPHGDISFERVVDGIAAFTTLSGGGLAGGPPAEEFALPLSTDQMFALKDIFPREVEIISRSERGGARISASSEARDADILASLRRRPCTSADVASGLGVHVNEALKHLEALIAAGKAGTAVTGRRSFYTVIG